MKCPLVEVGGVLTALALLLPWPAWLGWAAGVLLGAGPFAGYITARTVGLPGDHADVGNWANWVGTVSLVVEAALVVLSIGMLLAHRHRLLARRHRLLARRHRLLARRHRLLARRERLLAQRQRSSAS
jgi:hypothetical protein